MAEETRRCFRCEEIKPIKQFRFHNKKLGTRHRRCNRCHANRRAVIVKNNPEKIREANLYYSGLTLEAYKALWGPTKGPLLDLSEARNG